MMSNESICIVLPTYCEAENVGAVLDRIDRAVPSAKILVVDDNSTDGTADIAEECAARRPGLHLMRRSEKSGLGSAYLAGFEQALGMGADLIVTMDSDLSHQPEQLPALLAAAERADLVLGSRYVVGGEIVNWPKRRKALSWTANRFVQTLFGFQVHDCTAGFRVYRRKVVEEILRMRPSSPGYSFQVDALYIAAAGGARITEVPICFVEREAGTSKMGLNEIIYGFANVTRTRLSGLRYGQKRD